MELQGYSFERLATGKSTSIRIFAAKRGQFSDIEHKQKKIKNTRLRIKSIASRKKNRQ
jgi:hypothetical protein